jgi:hypothetical protein
MIRSILAFSAICLGQTLEFKAPVEEKNFYVLAMIERSPEAFRSDAVLTRIAE